MSKPFFCRSNLRASSSLVALLLVVTLASIFTITSAETLTVTGTMHPGVEAGCWLIRADDTGTEYLLIDVPKPLRVDGLHVQVTGEIKTDIASYCMQGGAALSHIILGLYRFDSTVDLHDNMDPHWRLPARSLWSLPRDRAA